MKKFIISLLVFLFCNVSITSAGTQLNPEEKATTELVSNIEKYINSLQTISGKFDQKSSNGAEETGTFYIKKPGKMRLEYESPMLLIADGNSIVYQDKKLDQISYISMDSNPASMILNKEIKLTGKNPNVEIKKIYANSDNTTEITLSTPNEKHSGTITLIFETLPLSLFGWKVTDPQGVTTNVTLSNIKPETSLSDSLFKITRGKSIGTKKKNKYY